MAEISLPFESRYYPLKKFFHLHQKSLEASEEFWAQQARQLDWFRTWDKVLEWEPPSGFSTESQGHCRVDIKLMEGCTKRHLVQL